MDPILAVIALFIFMGLLGSFSTNRVNARTQAHFPMTTWRPT